METLYKEEVKVSAHGNEERDNLQGGGESSAYGNEERDTLQGGGEFRVRLAVCERCPASCLLQCTRISTGRREGVRTTPCSRG